MDAGVGKYDGKTEIDVSGKFVLPGFIDAHIHLESSMVSFRIDFTTGIPNEMDGTNIPSIISI